MRWSALTAGLRFEGGGVDSGAEEVDLSKRLLERGRSAMIIQARSRLSGRAPLRVTLIRLLMSVPLPLMDKDRVYRRSIA